MRETPSSSVESATGTPSLRQVAKGCVLAFDPKNDLIAGEIGFDQNALVGHVLQQVVGPVLVHQVDAVTDAVGQRLFHGEPDMAAQALGRASPGASSPACRLT